MIAEISNTEYGRNYLSIRSSLNSQGRAILAVGGRAEKATPHDAQTLLTGHSASEQFKDLDRTTP